MVGTREIFKSRMSRLREYPPNWNEIVHYIRDVRDQKTCKVCLTQWHDYNVYGVCIRILQVAHLDHDKTHNSYENLLTMCSFCHAAYDKGNHIPNPLI